MIEKRIDQKIELICSYQKEKIESLVSICESPIEKLFLTDFMAYYFKNSLSLVDVNFIYDDLPFQQRDGSRLFNYKQESQDVGDEFSFWNGSKYVYGLRIKHNFFNFHFDIFPQYHAMMPSGKKYRLDFAILVKLTADKSKQEFKIFIECDGHEFHKEPVQIAKDNFRANELKANGWMEFRYSGKMIWDDQFTAAKDFDQYLYNVLNAHGDFFDDVV